MPKSNTPSNSRHHIDRDGRTKLFDAIVHEDTESVRKLIEQGYSVTHADKNGHTPLHFAAMYAKLDVARMLLDAGADIEARDGWGNTPLMRSVTYVNLDGKMILFLLERGANPDADNNYGVSARKDAEQTANFDFKRYFNGY